MPKRDIIMGMYKHGSGGPHPNDSRHNIRSNKKATTASPNAHDSGATGTNGNNTRATTVTKEPLPNHDLSSFFEGEGSPQARSQVSRFGGAQYIFEEARLLL